MKNNPNDIMKEAASIAVDAIDGQLDTKIWRTRLRIQELILTENPYLKNNIFIANQSLFLFILLDFCFMGSITTLTGKKTFDSGEKFEEAELEPILYTDTDYGTGNTEDVIIRERIYQAGLAQGKSFEEVKNEISITARIQVPALISELNHSGLINSNIFYKYPHGANDKKSESLPQLPAYI